MSLIHIEPKRCWPIRLKNFKSNIYLEQSDEIVHTVVVVRNGCGTLITMWMDEWMDELSWFFAYWCKFRKVKSCFNKFWVVAVKTVHGTLISKCMNETGQFSACYTYLRKLKVILIVIAWTWWNMGCPFRSWDSIICFISRMK